MDARALRNMQFSGRALPCDARRDAIDGPLQLLSKDFPLESTLRRVDAVQREADCKSLIGLC